MQERRPAEPFALSLIAGISILIVGLFISLNLTSLPDYVYRAMGSKPHWFFIFGVITGLIVIFGAIMLYFQPRQHLVWGIIVLVFSILSIPSSGGLAMGVLLGIIGGAFGIAWKPGEVSTISPPLPRGIPMVQAYVRKCPQCGRVHLQDFRNCPYCGKALK